MLSRLHKVAESVRARPLATAERISATTHLLSSLEYLVRKSDRMPGGLNDWTQLREQVPAKGRFTQVARDFIARENVTQAIHGSRALAAAVLISPVRNNKVRMAADAYLAGSQIITYHRHLFGTDGSDQVSFLVQAAAALGRAGGTKSSRTAAVHFIGAQTVLSYGASGWAKLPGETWRSGEALTKIMRTRTYGDEWFFKNLEKHPAAARALCHTVLAIECGFPLLLLKKGRFIDAGLVVMGGFHLANARLMGLSRFALAFSSTYPAVRALAKGTGEAE